MDYKNYYSIIIINIKITHEKINVPQFEIKYVEIWKWRYKNVARKDRDGIRKDEKE